MAKGKIIGGGIGVAIVAIIILVYGTAQVEDIPDSMKQIHGTIRTDMGSPILGDPDAEITIVEFGDYQCHACYNWFHNTKPPLLNEYINTGKVNFVFVDMAFLGRDSPVAAQATYCAEDQGKYWEYHNILYESQEDRIDNGWASKERLKTFAFVLGLDTELFDSCLDSKKYERRVQNNTSEGRTFGVTGTPTFLIVSESGEEQKLVGQQPFAIFKRVIDSMI